MTHNKKRISLDLAHMEQTVLAGKALSSPIRLEILKMLIDKSLNISEIAAALDLPQSSAALHVKVLEEAGMISVTERPGVRGAQKVCGIAFEDLYFNAFAHQVVDENAKEMVFPMDIGNYFDCKVEGNCGIVSEKGYLGVEDSSYGFFSNERKDAGLLWFQTGFVEYRFPTYLFRKEELQEISFSFEICSEAPGYQNEWPSDISVWIGEKEIATVHSPGDFGDRRGYLNPKWWGDTMTQYGILKTITINKTGCFENDIQCSEYTLQDLHIQKQEYISFKIGVKKDATHVGGMNLFGTQFGDYAQGIIMKVKTRHPKI